MHALKILILVAFIIRLALPIASFLVSPSYENFYIHMDSDQYIQLAKQIVNNGDFSFQTEPELFRTPGYPVLIIPGVLIGYVEWITIILQAFLSCATIFLIYKISLQLFKNSSAAFAAALLYAIEPLSVLYCSRIMSETLFSFLVCLFIYLIIRYFKDGSKLHLYLASLPFIAAIYTRPVLYYFQYVLAAVFLFWIIINWQDRKKHLLIFCSFIIIIFLLTSVWIVRNGIMTGYWKFSSTVDITLYFYKTPAVLAAKQHRSLNEVQDELVKHYLSLPPLKTWTVVQKYQYMRNEGLKVIMNNPFLYLKTHVKGFFRILFDPSIKDYMNLFQFKGLGSGYFGAPLDMHYFSNIMSHARKEPASFLWFLILGMLLITHYLFTIISISSRKFQWDLSIVLIFILLAYLIFLSAGELGIARYRHPVMPFLSIIAAFSIQRFMHYFSRRKNLTNE
ncbi:MAG: hypothetical protein A2Y62_13250 [Candidatus Fischerbacteria bacterium RBG_13_37_8]|uniref:Glycosyltransferase RgtA/B/C/D-like domain-containing protein n=1 Tax=Candidatus Fischerbacteria bacterium RBG_13_37_8 TaxID=1817863 RepID=A0A1F5VN99_9BACT|nr:MAG: hypothetical protein A2Y62_13250 [Candidatus Fischerbacteria bacterium RBG_13_37_8]